MKKNGTKNQEQKSHRLSLNRETLRFLDNPDLLELARGGMVSENKPESTSQDDSFVRC